jgi:hypothetical protein
MIDHMPRPSQEQTEALWLSAEHWLENWQHASGDRTKPWATDSISCECCNLYIDADCVGCPISEYTGKKDCKGSPYANTRRQSPFSVELEYRFLVCLALGEDPKQDPVLSTEFFN